MSTPTVQELNPQNEKGPPPEVDHDRHPQRVAGMTVAEAFAEQQRATREIEARIAKLSAK